jgi:hypothetical protein
MSDDKPKLKFVFSHYKFPEKRICDSEFSMEGDEKIGVLLCPKCGNRLVLTDIEVNQCLCGATVTIKK